MFNNDRITTLEREVHSLKQRVQTLLCKAGEHAEQKIGLRSSEHKPHIYCNHCCEILSETTEIK
jgi:hypothetical protein